MLEQTPVECENIFITADEGGDTVLQTRTTHHATTIVLKKTQHASPPRTQPLLEGMNVNVHIIYARNTPITDHSGRSLSLPAGVIVRVTD